MKKLIPIITIVFAATVQLATAMQYQAGDLLLVFREDGGYSDVEFDIGSVSNLLSLTTGSQTTISYDASLVSDNFGGTLSGVKVALVAATTYPNVPDGSERIWVTDSSLTVTPKEVGFSTWNSVRGKIEGVGLTATSDTFSNTMPYVVSSGDSGSYSQIVSDGKGGSSIPTFDGQLTTFSGFSTVESAYPATLAFYSFTHYESTPKPPGTLVGSFTLNADGSITYIAGQLPTTLTGSTITQITRSNGVSAISFTTSTGSNYRLWYAADLLAPRSSWTQLGGSVAGDNTVKTLTDTTADVKRFYTVQSY